MNLPSTVFAAALILIFCNTTNGCRVEVCRKRRAVIEGEEVLLDLQGCSGRTKPWVRQVAYCLGRSTFEVASTMQSWYARTYRECFANCDMVREGTQVVADINLCVNCFKNSLPTAEFLPYDNFTLTQIDDCVNQYVQASLSNELPTFEAETNERGRITLPSAIPENDWWSLTVRLPCKPPLFRFLNAYCINSFEDDVLARDFVLAQNRLIHSDNIVFLATFNDACRFDIEDVEIVWSESVPAFAFPQLSSFPSNMPPDRTEIGSIFFDAAAFSQLQETDDFNSPEFSSSSPRRKRSLASGKGPMREIGIVMPCEVRSFKVSNEDGDELQVTSKASRHLINPMRLFNNSYNNSPLDLDSLSFTLDFGFESTGCVFGSSEPKVTPNPPPGWIDQRKITCYTCRGVDSEEECLETGRTKQCAEGEICQSEVRQISPNKISITKLCKQKNACENNWMNNNRLQCRPGKPASTCRCCCSEDLCNENALHCT